MSQVATTVGADNFGARHAQSTILVASDGSGDAVKVGRPAATRLELVIGLVKRCAASCTSVDAFRGVVLVKLARARCFGTLLSQDAKLLCGSKLVAISSI